MLPASAEDWKGGYCFHKDNQSPIDLPADGAPGPGFFFKYKPGAVPRRLAPGLRR